MITIDIKESKNCNGEWGMFLSFPYDEKLLGIIRALPSRYWDKNTKTWEVPFKKFDELLGQLSDYEIEIHTNASVFAPKNETIEYPLDFQFKTQPFTHQVEGFNYGLSHNRWLLGDEQGLGKTKQVIDISVAKKYQMGYEHCLIICGVNGLKWNWQSEIKTHSDESGYILGQRVKGKKLVIGSTKDKIADLDNLVNIKDYFIITNVESLRDDDIVARISKLCNDGVIGLVAADECHKMKNPSSQQGKGFLKIQADTMIAMTGTPLMNTPLDLYIILKWLGFEKHPFYTFKNHYCIMGGYGGYQVVGYRHLDDLQEQLNEIMLRRLKADVLDLPDKIFVNEYVEMTPKQNQIYKEVLADIKANIDKVKLAPNPLSEMIRLRQVTGFTGILSSFVEESAKLDRMEEIVDDAVANGKKVVIFSNWTQMTDIVEKRLSKYDCLCITGDTKDEDRQLMVDAFQKDDDFKVIVGTIGAMGTGLTLTAGTVEIFLDEPWNMALKDQAVDRCHRIGASENVTIYTLIAKNTVDEKINELVASKGAMADRLVDGKIQGSKGDLVDYLLG